MFGGPALLCALLVAGCGRLDFDGSTSGGDAASGNLDYVASVLADQPFAYFRLDDDVAASDDVVVDSSGNHHDGVLLLELDGASTPLQAGALAAGHDPAMRFVGEGNPGDGSAAFVQVADAIGLFAGDFTVEYWVEPLARPFGGYHSSLFICERLNSSGFRTGMDMTDLTVKYWTDEAGGAVNVNTATALVLGRWSHVVITRQAGVVDLYIDGQLESTTGDDMRPPDAGVQCGFGAFHGEPGDLRFDEVALYPTALAADRIAKHHDVGVTP